MTAHIYFDEKVDLTGKTDTLPHQFVLRIADNGDDEHSKIMSEKILTLKRIVKAMGGSLEADNMFSVIVYVLTVPCRAIL